MTSVLRTVDAVRFPFSTQDFYWLDFNGLEVLFGAPEDGVCLRFVAGPMFEKLVELWQKN